MASLLGSSPHSQSNTSDNFRGESRMDDVRYVMGPRRRRRLRRHSLFYYNYYFLVDSHDNGQTGSTKDWPLELNSTPTACVMPGGSFGWQKSHRDPVAGQRIWQSHSCRLPLHTTHQQKKKNITEKKEMIVVEVERTRHVHTRGGIHGRILESLSRFLLFLPIYIWVEYLIMWSISGAPQKEIHSHSFFFRCRAAIRKNNTHRDREKSTGNRCLPRRPADP